MAFDRGQTSGGITIKGGKEIVEAMQTIEAKVAKGLARGAIGEAANVIREVAAATAVKIGLLDQGKVLTAKGNWIQHRGQIPLSVYAAVERGKPGIAIAKVAIDSRISEGGRSSQQKSAASHWIFVELGSAHNPPRPFLRPALIEGAQLAVDACIEVLSRGMDRYNVPGG